MKIMTIILAAGAIITLAPTVSAGDYEIRDRHGKVTGTIREPSGPVLNRYEVRDRSGKLTHTIRPGSGPVMRDSTIHDKSGRKVGTIRKR